MGNFWWMKAACDGLDTTLWFDFPAGSPERRDAVMVCQSCPVRLDCLEAALAEEGQTSQLSRWGIRGGLDPDARAKVSRAWYRIPDDVKPTIQDREIVLELRRRPNQPVRRPVAHAKPTALVGVVQPPAPIITVTMTDEPVPAPELPGNWVARAVSKIWLSAFGRNHTRPRAPRG